MKMSKFLALFLLLAVTIPVIAQEHEKDSPETVEVSAQPVIRPRARRVQFNNPQAQNNTNNTVPRPNTARPQPGMAIQESTKTIMEREQQRKKEDNQEVIEAPRHTFR